MSPPENYGIPKDVDISARYLSCSPAPRYMPPLAPTAAYRDNPNVSDELQLPVGMLWCL